MRCARGFAALPVCLLFICDAHVRSSVLEQEAYGAYGAADVSHIVEAGGAEIPEGDNFQAS